MKTFDVHSIRNDFPILKTKAHGKPLIYLDNAATTQKPQCMLDALDYYYAHTNANIHRGVYELSELATEAYEATRNKIQGFINAAMPSECVFVRGATEAINLVATCYGDRFLKAGDEILISALEHHSNIVPWQLLCKRMGTHLKVIPMNSKGELILDNLDLLLSERTKFVSIAHVSNALGTIIPVQDIIQKAHAKGIPVLLDGAQAIPHFPIDVQALDCDFYVFSAHKLYGPTGIGVLYGKQRWLEALPPYQGGGEMILKVTFEETTYNKVPHKFEAGTPPIAETIAFGKTLDYLNQLDWTHVLKYEENLLNYATKALLNIPGITLIGTADQKISVLSFIMEGVHPHDIGTITDQEGVAIRTGHHCAMPVMDFFKIPATARASLGIYNTEEDINQLVKALYQVKKIFKL